MPTALRGAATPRARPETARWRARLPEYPRPQLSTRPPPRPAMIEPATRIGWQHRRAGWYLQAMRMAGFGIGVLGVLACQKPVVDEARRSCASCRWELLGVHAQAAAQPTKTGNALITLCPWHSRLYVGYGDYQENTGPIDVTAWDPAKHSFVR